MENKYSRRSFFKLGLVGAAIVPFVANMSKSFAGAACSATAPVGKAIASSTEGMGKNLEYVANASDTKNATYKAGSSCGSCNFYNAAKAEGGFAPCAMLGNKYVSNCGWCKSYKKKA